MLLIFPSHSWPILSLRSHTGSEIKCLSCCVEVLVVSLCVKSDEVPHHDWVQGRDSEGSKAFDAVVQIRHQVFDSSDFGRNDTLGSLWSDEASQQIPTEVLLHQVKQVQEDDFLEDKFGTLMRTVLSHSFECALKEESLSEGLSEALDLIVDLSSPDIENRHLLIDD